jgi:DNA modification methylase
MAKKAKKPAVPTPAEPRVLPSRAREETWPIARLRPYELNAKEHPQEQIDYLRQSYRQHGPLQRLIVDEAGEIISGHGRHQALLQENVAEIGVLVVDSSWTEEEKRLCRISDNSLQLATGWDKKKLKAELQALDGLGVPLDQLGFDAGQLGAWLQRPSAGQTDEDDAPEPAPVTVSARGDVWLLGRHRLTCGDSTNPADVARVLAGAKPHLMVTDPPCGVEYDPGWRQEQGLNGAGTAKGKVLNDDRADWREAWALFPGDVAYVWHASTFCSVVAGSLEAVGFKLKAQIVWVKQRLVIGRTDYHFQHEPCLYAVKDGADEHWHFVPEHELATYAVREGATSHFNRKADDGRKQTTVWNIEHVKSDTGHGTQKPVECMRRPIENNSKEGDSIYEPFSGSGTTLIACEIMRGRKCCAVELNPLYVDIDVRRWQNFTGQAATLEGDGRTFEQIAAARAAGAEAA